MDIYEIRNELNQGRTIYDLPLRVTFYARVSTDKDEQLHSLSAQVGYYTDLIRSCRSWRFVEGYVDEGLSGTSVARRENFLRMIGDAEEGKFDFIVTKEISRFSRNTLDSIQFTQKLLRCGVGVLFQSDNINTLMPDAELRLTIMSSIAQDEVRKISERVKFGFKRAVENGVVLGNDRIWGYRKQEGRLVIDEEEAELVRAAFDLYANERLGLRAVSARLAERGWLGSGGRPLSFSTVRNILSNPKYKGYYCGRKSCKFDYKLHERKHFPPEQWVVYKDEESVPPIVSEELWDKANRILAERSKARGAGDGSRNRYPYSGKVICGVHGRAYHHAVYGGAGGKKEVWQCPEYGRNGKKGCESPALYTSELDEILRQCVGDALGGVEIVGEMLELYAAMDENRKLDGEIERCRTAIRDAARRKDRLLDLSIAGRISDEEFSQRNERFNGEIAAQKRRLEQLEAERAAERGRTWSEEELRGAAAAELEFPAGFSGEVVDAILDHVDVLRTVEKGTVELEVWLRGADAPERWQIRRVRGKPSVCSVQYI